MAARQSPRWLSAVTADKRHKRKDITGAKNWKISAAGIAYHNEREQPTTYYLAGLPSVDLSPEYGGPIPSAGLHPRLAKVDPALHPTYRLVEEVVAFEFLGRPCSNWPSTMCVVHLDGDKRNCYASNLRWARIEFDDDELLKRDLALMQRPNHTGKGSEARRAAPTKPAPRLLFVSAHNIPGMIPTPSKGQ